MEYKLSAVISAEVSRFKKGCQDALKEMQGFSNKSEKEIEEIDNAINEAGVALTDFGKKAGMALAAVGTALVGSAAATEEYRVAQAKLNAAFETAGASAETAKGVYNDLYRTIGDSDVAVEAANHLAKLTTNQEDLASWTNICQGVYATFGDSLPIEGLTEAANETAKVGTLTGSLADALNWAGVNEEKFQEQLDACNTEAEREKLIRETLNSLYSDAAKKYEEQAGAIMEQREANAKLQETLAALGEAMAPVLTAFTTFAADALAPVVEKIKPLAEEYGPKLSEALETAGEAAGKVFNLLAENWVVIAVLGGVIAGIAAAIGLYNTVTAIKVAMDAAQVTTLGALIAAQWASAAATAAALAPYLLIVAVIATVIAIIVLLVQNWDAVKETVTNVAKAVEEKVREMVEKATKFFNELGEKIAQKIIEIADGIRNTFEKIKATIAEKIQQAREVVSAAFTVIKTTISNSINNAKAAVASVFEGIRSTIKSKIDAAREAVHSAIEKIKGFFNFKWELPKIKLPHFSIKGEFSLMPPSIPSFSVDWYARGGVFDSPTLFPYGNGSIGGLGEAGAEAIVPLEKNTEWLDKIAQRLNGSMGGGTIVMQVDGTTFAKVAVNSINDLTRQRGSLPLRLA